MWYAISISGGLFLGLALLIWGLRERAARHRAERATSNLQIEVSQERTRSRDLLAQVHALQTSLVAEQTACTRLRAIAKAVRAHLLTSSDPATIKNWLDQELTDNDV